MRFLKPLDTNLLHQIFKSHKAIITVEDASIIGGFGSAIIEFASEHNYQNKIKVIGIPDEFVEHGTVEELQHLSKVDSENIKKVIDEMLFLLVNSC
jgi:1-deoxy-D-xylulose-5-phosphate synthase